MSDQPQPDPQAAPQPQTVVNVNMANTNTAVAEATAVATAKAAPQEWVPPVPARTGKSILVAYLYFVLAGYLGWHRFYLGRPRAVWLFLFWVLLAVSAVAEPLLLLGPGALLVLDLFSIPRWVRRYESSDPSDATPQGTVRRPPVLRGLGWRKVEPQAADGTVPPAVSAPPPLIVQSPSPGAGHTPQSDHREPPPVANPARREAPTDLRTLLLREAHRGDGKLTVTQAVMATGEDWERVEGCLRDMVDAGYVDVDNEPHSGVIVYVFPELVGRPRSGRDSAS